MLCEEEAQVQRSPGWAAQCIYQDSKEIHVTAKAEDEEEADEETIRFYKAIERCWLFLE